jgi:hypothetical protein
LIRSVRSMPGRFMVEAPAFMRGKERLNAPGRSLDFDHALERWQCQLGAEVY